MQDFVPLDASPRSKRSASEWAKDKVKDADFVAVGVNVVVGALLVGGLVGALFLPNPAGADPTVNAAIVSQDQTTGNSTEASEVEGSANVGEEKVEEDDDERPRDK